MLLSCYEYYRLEPVAELCRRNSGIGFICPVSVTMGITRCTGTEIGESSRLCVECRRVDAMAISGIHLVCRTGEDLEFLRGAILLTAMNRNNRY